MTSVATDPQDPAIASKGSARPEALVSTAWLAIDESATGVFYGDRNSFVNPTHVRGHEISVQHLCDEQHPMIGLRTSRTHSSC